MHDFANTWAQGFLYFFLIFVRSTRWYFQRQTIMGVIPFFWPINTASQGLAINNTLHFMTKINRQTVPEKLTAEQFFFVKCKKHHSSWCKAETVGSALQICTVGIRTHLELSFLRSRYITVKNCMLYFLYNWGNNWTLKVQRKYIRMGIQHGCVKSTVIEIRQHQLGRMTDFPPPVNFSVFDL